MTLSAPQAELARGAIEAAGLSDRVEMRVLDYREIATAPFDKIASVGMYEHVGRAELDTYVETVHGLLRPGGLFLNHGITRLHPTPPPRADTFINRYVFPDGELHPVTDVIAALEGAGFEVRDVESLREHYAADPAPLAPEPRGPPRRGGRRGRHGSRARVAALHARLRAGLRDGRHRDLPDAPAREGAPHPLPLNRAELLRG